MKLSISNIAWNRYEDRAIRTILQEEKIFGVEIAPGIVWDDPTQRTPPEIKEYKKFWHEAHISVVALQGILFGHEELKLFGSMAARKEMHDYIIAILELADRLGAPIIVFGSPKNKTIPDSMSRENAYDIAYDFFNSLGYTAQKHGIVIAIEANPKQYGTNFLTTTNEAVQFVQNLAHPHVKLQLDIGTMTANKEQYATTTHHAMTQTAHIHISEPDLMPIPQPNTHHVVISKTLGDILYPGFTSIEMRGKQKSNIQQITKSIAYVKRVYSHET